MSAPQPLPPRCHHRQKSSSSSLSSDYRTLIGRVYNAPNRFLTAIRYPLLGRPSVLPDDFLLDLAPHKRPPLSEVRSLAEKGRLYTDDDGILVLVRRFTPPAPIFPDKSGRLATRVLHHEPTRIYVPMLLRPWIICKGAMLTPPATSTLSMLERFYWWIGMSICTRWRLRRCLQCQARNQTNTLPGYFKDSDYSDGPAIVLDSVT